MAKNKTLPSSLRKQLRRQLSGDLDNIVLMAMRKDPQSRYASVAELSEDLRRHLEHLPVVARDDRWSYRAGKFIRRHSLALATVVLVIASLVAGIVSTLSQARRADRRFEILRQLANTVLYDLHDQAEQLSGSTAVRASMIQMVATYLDGLAIDSRGDPSLDLEIAKAYHRVAAVEGHPFRPNLGRTSAALSHYAKALSIHETLASRPETRTQAIKELIDIHIELGDIQAMLGNPVGARYQFQKAAEVAAEVSARNGAELSLESQINIYIRLGDEERNAGFADAALPNYSSALEIARRWAESDGVVSARRALRAAHVRTATALFESGQIYAARDNYEVARKINAGLLKLGDSSDDRWGMIQIVRALGDVLGGPDELNLGDTDGAFACYREAVLRAEALSSVDPEDVRARRALISSYSSVGRLRLDTDPRGALDYYNKCLPVAEALLQTDKSNIEYKREVALARLAVARCLRRLSRTEEALQLLWESVELQQSIEASAPQRIWMNRPLGWIYLEIGHVLADRHDSEGASSNLQAGLAVAEKLLGRAPSSMYLQRDLAEAMETAGRAYLALSMQPGITKPKRREWKAEARSLFHKSLAIWQDWSNRKLAIPYAGRRLNQAQTAIASID